MKAKTGAGTLWLLYFPENMVYVDLYKVAKQWGIYGTMDAKKMRWEFGTFPADFLKWKSELVSMK